MRATRTVTSNLAFRYEPSSGAALDLVDSHGTLARMRRREAAVRHRFVQGHSALPDNRDNSGPRSNNQPCC